MAPSLAFRSIGAAAREQKNAPFRFTASIRSHISFGQALEVAEIHELRRTRIVDQDVQSPELAVHPREHLSYGAIVRHVAVANKAPGFAPLHFSGCIEGFRL